MANGNYSTSVYFLEDQPRSLFPMDTSALLVSHAEAALQQFVYANIASGDSSFLPQQRCYAAKRHLFLRRTVKLDPVAEYFLYDVIYRNRRSFRSDHRDTRRSFGYRFGAGRPQSSSAQYAEFRFYTWMAGFQHRHSLVTDVASYFNTIYHHDLVTCVRNLNWSGADVELLGKFLREINSGRSIDCLPQGIHPAKVLGAEFLRFVDDSHRLKSAEIIRFQDDIHLFDDDIHVLQSDLLALQALLGERGLSLSTEKTVFDGGGDTIEDEVDEMRRSLLRKRGEILAADYLKGEEGDAGEANEGAEPEEEVDPNAGLSEEQVGYLIDLITTPDVEETDAELVLRLLKNHGETVVPQMVGLLERFPGLSKNVYSYVASLEDRTEVAELILVYLNESPRVTEFQLFWLVRLAQAFLSKSPDFGKLLISAFEHPNATGLTRAKVLEVPDARFGLNDLREEQLRAGRSDWTAWAAAAGTRCLKKGSRNHLLGYFRNGSDLNRLVADCVRDLPEAI